MKYWDTYKDELDYSKFLDEGIALLERRYSKNGMPIKNHDKIEETDYPVPIPIVAKGISACLCSDSVFSPKPPSLKNLLKENEEVPTEEIFKIYFRHCLKFLNQRNKKNPLPHKRKTNEELIIEHLEQESNFLQESIYLYDGEEIKKHEIEIIQALNEVALYYQDWINNQHEISFSENNFNGVENVPKELPVTFEELFLQTDKIQNCINVLKKVNPPILTPKNKFNLGERKKGAIVAWITALKYKGYILSNIQDSRIANLLNSKFEGLNLGKDGKTLRNLGTTSYNQYYKDILNLLP